MKKNEIKRLLMEMRTSENENSVNYLLGLLDMMSDEELQTKLEKTNINEENIREFLNSKIEKTKIEQEQSNNFIDVNKLFCYGRTGDTVHMHLIPKDLRGLKAKLGDEAFYQYYKDQLSDFLSRLQDIFRSDSTITSLFAVSPIFYNHNFALAHENLGFDKIVEIDPENEEDKMGIKQKEYFLDMFNKNAEHRRRVYYTNISREKLLGTEYTRISEDEKTMEDD